tara:strand:- start:27 stop:371 length:345 start_codon:yes stop_codon:yes gene_type:complete
VFGKYTENIDSRLSEAQLIESLNAWSTRLQLKSITSNDKHIFRYRFGNPFISNPIYIEVAKDQGIVTISGWVQTLIPFLRWKLVEMNEPGVGTVLDYRKKGGLFVYELRREIGS